MNNSIFNLQKYSLDNYNFSNIFNSYKNIKLTQEYIDSISYMFYYKIIADDSRLDSLSYFEYGDSKYWDILFKINLMDNILDLPTNYDNVIAKLDNEMEEFISKGFSNNINNSFRESLETSLVEKNEKHRKFRFIKKEYISKLLGELY